MNGNLILVDVYGVEPWVEKQLRGNHIHRGLPLALWRRSIFSLVNPQHILKVLLIRGDFRYPSHGLWPLWGGGGLLPVFPVTFFTTTCLKPSTIEARVPFNSGNKSYVKFGPTVSVKSHKLRHLGIGTSDHNSEILKTLFEANYPQNLGKINSETTFGCSKVVFGHCFIWSVNFLFFVSYIFQFGSSIQFRKNHTMVTKCALDADHIRS